MGFSVDSSTAGSSVRFDPPDSRDHVSLPQHCAFAHWLTTTFVQPITFHRRKTILNLTSSCWFFDVAFSAHPDSTIPPNMLRDFGKRLKRTYGWNDDDFIMVRLGMAVLHIAITDQRFRKSRKAHACRLTCVSFCFSRFLSVFLACCSVLFPCSHHSYEIVFSSIPLRAPRHQMRRAAGLGRLLGCCCRGL